MNYLDEREAFGEIPTHFDQVLAGALRQTEGKPVKRKLYTSVLIAALLVVALAAAALAMGLRRSAEADAAARAREALMAEYNLTPESIGCFTPEAAREGDTWSITFTGTAWELERLGTYTVQLRPGEPPQTSWNYDDMDPSLWQDGNMDAPAWGQKQIMAKLQLDGEQRDARARADWDSLSFEEEAELSPVFWGTVDLAGKTVRFDRIVPNAEDIPADKVSRMAMDAIVSAYGVKEDGLAGFAEHISFGQPQGGSERQYVVQLTRRTDMLWRPSEHGTYTVYIASPSGETLFLQWDVFNEFRTLPDGPLKGYEHAVEEFMNTGSLAARSAAEKADIVTRVRDAGLEALIEPALPYVMPGVQDMPETDAMALGREILMRDFEMEGEALTLFDAVSSLLDTPEGRCWEIVYTPKAPQTPYRSFWQADILEKIGAYTIRFTSAAGDVQEALWDRAEEWTDGGAYTRNNWATAPVYHGKLLKWAKALQEATDAIWAKYPEGALDSDFTMEDVAANDAYFREAGFDGFPRSMPGDGDISYEEAWAVGREAILAEMPDTAKALDAGEIHGHYSLFDPEVPAWRFTVYFISNGLEISYQVAMDAKTGEIFLIQAVTGGNG